MKVICTQEGETFYVDDDFPEAEASSFETMLANPVETEEKKNGLLQVLSLDNNKDKACSPLLLVSFDDVPCGGLAGISWKNCSTGRSCSFTLSVTLEDSTSIEVLIQQFLLTSGIPEHSMRLGKVSFTHVSVAGIQVVGNSAVFDLTLKQ